MLPINGEHFAGLLFKARQFDRRDIEKCNNTSAQMNSVRELFRRLYEPINFECVFFRVSLLTVDPLENYARHVRVRWHT